MDAGLGRLGRYLIEAELGRGAMGVVYRARDPRIDRLIALKTLQPQSGEPAPSSAVKERFLNEGRAAGRLNHPGIVSVYDADEDPTTGIVYLAMEHVDGTDMRRLLKDGLPHGRIVEIIVEVATALDHAHARGVVHRDVKPANVLIDTEGHARLTDFGIARLVTSTMTVAGEFLGTPASMSPEQVLSQPVSSATDVFSLGVVLYEGVAGRRPFDGDSMASTTHAIVNATPAPPSQVNPALSKAFNPVIARALAKAPEARYRSAGALARAAVEALDKDRASAPIVTPAPHGKRPLAWIGLAGGLVVVGAVLGGAAMRHAASQRAVDPPAAKRPISKSPVGSTALAPTSTDPPATKADPAKPAATKPAPTKTPPKGAVTLPAARAKPPTEAPATATTPVKLASGTLQIEVSTLRAGTLVVREGGRTLGRLEVNARDQTADAQAKSKSMSLTLPAGHHGLDFSFERDKRSPSRRLELDVPPSGIVSAKVSIGLLGKELEVKLR